MRNHFHIDKNLEIKKGSSLKAQIINKKNSKFYNLILAKNLNLGYYLITPMIFGVFLGLFLDRLLKTGRTFFIILFSIGIIGTFYNLYKIYKDD